MGSATIFFIDPINEESGKVLMNQCIAAVDNGATGLQIRMSSPGGFTQTGFWLANILRSLPVPLATHNIGEVSSIALPIFLAAPTRSAEPTSRFVMHPLTWTASEPATIPHHTLREWVASLNNDVARYVEIFEEATSSAEERFDIRTALLGNAPSVMNPAQALKAGVVHKVASLPLER
ncbi:MAG: ATP-dependent Clp protease proteolytic subunit [bacterium]|nr:ATP-dependent Clp protease proteolytic subunit [bacterium]MDE0600405.1 ATP-dependent Clp protease proteolytic subunit [bacterium]